MSFFHPFYKFDVEQNGKISKARVAKTFQHFLGNKIIQNGKQTLSIPSMGSCAKPVTIHTLHLNFLWTLYFPLLFTPVFPFITWSSMVTQK